MGSVEATTRCYDNLGGCFETPVVSVALELTSVSQHREVLMKHSFEGASTLLIMKYCYTQWGVLQELSYYTPILTVNVLNNVLGGCAKKHETA